MLPNLVIAGVPKAGTTSLFNYLARHPAVCGSSVKETRYFAAVQYGEELSPLRDYEEFFDACAGRACAMEATPGYMQGGRPVAAVIDRTLPGVRILIILRDPVDRLVSFYRFQKSTLQIDADIDIDDYVDRCLSMPTEDFARRGVFRWTGLFGGYYGEHLPPWLDVFGDRCRVVFFEELHEDPEALTDRTLAWLGLDPAEREPLEGEVHNRTISPRIRALQRAGLMVNRRFEPFWHRHPEMKRRIRSAYHRVNAGRGRERIPDEALRRIGELYAESNGATAELLRARGYERLPGWVAGAGAQPAGSPPGLTHDATP